MGELRIWDRIFQNFITCWIRQCNLDYILSTLLKATVHQTQSDDTTQSVEIFPLNKPANMSHLQATFVKYRTLYFT
jgi:hypothetical protein